MDPITALGLAANVAQFIEFGLGIVSKGQQLYRAGSTVYHTTLQSVASDLELLTSELQRNLKTVTASKPLGIDDEALKTLCEDCSKTATELIEVLEELKVDTRQQKRVWKSVRQALKSVWKKEGVDALVERLLQYRDQINTRILMTMR